MVEVIPKKNVIFFLTAGGRREEPWAIAFTGGRIGARVGRH